MQRKMAEYDEFSEESDLAIHRDGFDKWFQSIGPAVFDSRVADEADERGMSDMGSTREH